MVSSTKSVVIHAPVEKVFAYLDDPMHQLEYWPSMVEISDVHLLPNGGNSYHWTYKMAGIRFEGTSEDVEHVANERVVSQTKGGIESTETLTFQPEGEDTKVDMKMDYTVPIPVLGKLAEAVIVKLNDHEGDVVMENLKTVLEAA